MATTDDTDADCKGKENFVQEMEDLDVSVVASSTSKKHKRGLKTMKKKSQLIDLNTSVRRKRLNSSLTKKLNLSINSVQKQSLRANNRALAVNLERTKQELRMALEMNQELRKEIQEKDMRIVTLERVSGLRNEEIEEEVLRRVEQNHATLRGILTAMGESLFTVSHNLSDALHHCVQSSRRSTIGSRKTSSVGGNTSNADLDVDIHGPVYQRSIYAQTQGSSLPLPQETLPLSDDLPAPPLPAFSASAHDMSVIAEQTMCLDDIEPLSDLDSSLLNQGISEESEVEISKPPVSSNKSEKTKTQVSKLPQRVPRKEKGANTGAGGSETSNADKEMVQDVSDQNIGQDVKNQSEAEKTGQTAKEKSKSLKKDRKIKEKNEKAMGMADRRGTFVVADAKELKSETENCTSDRNDRNGVEEESTDDKRKTFVKPQSPNLDVKNNRRGTFVVPPNPTESLDEPEPMEDEDQTRYFNTDMEMTEVLSFTQPISSESMNKSSESSGLNSAEKKNKKEQAENKGRAKEVSQEKNGENPKKNSGKVTESTGKSNLEVLKSKLEKIKSTDSLKSSKASKDVSEEKIDKTDEKKESEIHGKSVVEMRVSKPGNFEYRVSRKQEDGTRQPVPLKPASRSRSKGKVKLSKSTSDVITTLAKTPGKPKNVFDFGDRTPTVTLDPKSLYDDTEKDDDQEKKQEGDSQREVKEKKSRKDEDKKSLKDESKSSKSMGEGKGKSTQSVKEAKLLPDNPVYYVPMAKGSPAVVKEPSRQSRRSRSKPRSYREASSDEEDLEEEEEEGKGKSKTRGRERSKSRKRHSSGGEEEQGGRRTRSQSRGRRDRKKEEEEDSEYQPGIERSKRQSRGRSRTRRTDEVDDKKEEGNEKVIKERASRSRTRKAAELQETEVQKDDTEEVKIIRKTRSKSRARSLKRNVKETEDKDSAAKEELSENSPSKTKVDEAQKTQVVEKPSPKASKPFLESLQKSPDVNEKVDKQQTKAFLASLVNGKEKIGEARKSSKPAEVLASSSSDEDVEVKVVEEGHKMSVNESLVEDMCEDKERSSTAFQEKTIKRKHHELEDDQHCKEKVEDGKQNAEKFKSMKNGQESGKDEAAKTTEMEDSGKARSGKQRDAKGAEKSKGSSFPVSENCSAVNDRLSQFVRERGRPKPMVMEDDDDITFSDFDKLYKHVSAKRATESGSDVKIDGQEEARGDGKEEKEENSGKKVETENMNFKTPSMPSRKSTKSAAKSRSKKSSKKNAKEEKVSEKENSVEQNVSQSKKKLELLKKRLTQIEPRKPSLEPLCDVMTTQSLPSTPNSEEPDRKRPRRGGPVSYKEKPLNSKIRRGDVFFESS